MIMSERGVVGSIYDSVSITEFLWFAARKGYDQKLKVIIDHLIVKK